MNELTGVQAFFRWAYPCAKYKRKICLITEEDFDFLNVLLLRQDFINDSHIRFFEKCFPLAVEDLYKYAEANGIEPEKVWTEEVVDEVWQNHHDREGICAVTEAGVCSLDGEKVRVIAGSKTCDALNIYNIPLMIGDGVFLHWGMVVKKSEEEEF